MVHISRSGELRAIWPCKCGQTRLSQSCNKRLAGHSKVSNEQFNNQNYANLSHMIYHTWQWGSSWGGGERQSPLRRIFEQLFVLVSNIEMARAACCGDWQHSYRITVTVDWLVRWRPSGLISSSCFSPWRHCPDPLHMMTWLSGPRLWF